VKIIVAKNAGFCPGVNNAINKVIELSQKTTKKIFTLGPLIHNKDVIRTLEERGIRAVEKISEIKDKKNSILVIRAHGIPPQLEKEIIDSGMDFVDATCPLVKNVHNVITKYVEKGYCTIIVGDPHHAEVLGLKGYAGANCYVISSIEDAKNLTYIEKANLVAQTTQEEDFFFEIVKIIKDKVKELIISNTICNPTRLRQKETIEFSKISDLVIVIGGKHSANTNRLYQICKNISKRAIYVENENELSISDLKDVNTLFITAGASTPNWLIERVERKIKELTKKENIFINIFNFISVSGIFTGFAAYGISYFIYANIGIKPDLILSLSISLSLMGVHIINRKIEKESSERDIKNIIFFKYRLLIKYLSYLSIILSVLISLKISLKTTLLISLFSILGLLYSRIKSIFKKPLAVKDMFISAGWAYMTCFIPLLEYQKTNTINFYYLLSFVFISSLIRNIITSLLQKHNDIIISPQSVLYALNEDKSSIILIFLIIITTLISLNLYNSKAGIFLSFYYLFFYILIKNKKIPDLISSEILIEIPFIAMILV